MPLSALLQSLAHALAAQPAAAGAYLVVAALLLAAYVPGRALALGAPCGSRAERVAVVLALGLAAEATLGFLLGLAGLFTPAAAAAGLAALQLPAVRLRRRPPEGVVSARSRLSEDPAGAAGGSGPSPGARLASRLRRRAPRAWVAVAAAALALILTWAFLATLALYPPLGFDSTLYHLPAARELVESHRLPFLADSRFPVFPQLNETLFALALLAGDDRAARLLELALAALVALGLYGWTAGRAGRAEASSAPTSSSEKTASSVKAVRGSPLRTSAGLWAAALWIGSPYVVLYGADAYVDVGLALFGFLSLVAADRWGESGHPRWAAAAGALAGAAAGVKYQGLFFVALAPAAVLLLGRGAGGRRRLRAAALALGVALLAAAPWYGRVLSTTGNPVFPFFSEVFGESVWSPEAARAPAPAPADRDGEPEIHTAGAVVGEGRGYPLGHRGAERRGPGEGQGEGYTPGTSNLSAPAPRASAPLRRLRAVAWGAAGAWPRWVGPPPFDPWLLALAPAALLLLRRPRRPAGTILLGLAYAPCSWLFAPDPRYLLAALPWACAAVALGLGRLAAAWGLGRPAVLSDGGRRRGLAAAAGLVVALALAAPGLVYAGYWIARLGPVPRGAEARSRFLELRRPGYAAIEWLDRRHGEDYAVYAYDAPDLRYFVRGRLLGDWTGPHRYALVIPELRSAPGEAAATLRGWGARYLLLVAPRAPGGAGGPLELRLPWRPVYEDASSRLYDLRSRSQGSGGAPSPLRGHRDAERRGRGRGSG